MSLAGGARLGPYEILSLLGAGGMGAVYKARDTRLGRTVAIKVLNEDLRLAAEWQERFDREARTIAAIRHPSICVLLDVGDHEATRYLVMEYLDGGTLAERLTRGPLPLDQALIVAIQIASALDAAHRAGIVHRDLKPSNVMLLGSSSNSMLDAKLLDFGLAKPGSSAVGGPPADSAVTAAPLSGQGTILGTLQYMAPEQIEGRATDARTDVFAFGLLLYEMLTGRAAFAADSTGGLLSAILRDHPPSIRETLAALPPALDRLVHRAIAKAPDDRWQNARDMELELRWIARGDAETTAPIASISARQRRSRRAIAAAAWLAALAVGATGAQLLRPAHDKSGAIRFSIDPPPGASLNNRGIAIAPDGRTVVFMATTDGQTLLYSRRLDGAGSEAIRGTEGAETPFLSPDGRSVGFFTSNRLWRIPIAGGTPVVVATTTYRYGATWLSDDRIVFASNDTPDLMQVPASGGTPTPLVLAKQFGDGLRLSWPRVTPGEKGLLFTVFGASMEDARIGAFDMKTGESRTLTTGTYPVVDPGGHVIFSRSANLWTARLDVARLELASQPSPLGLEAVTNSGGLAAVAISDDGTLVTVPGGRQSFVPVIWDRGGKRQDLEAAASPGASDLRRRIEFSPDGRAVGFVAPVPGGVDIWTFDVASKTLSRATFAEDATPFQWSPDGRIIYRSPRQGGLVRLRPGNPEIEHLVKVSSVVSPFGIALSRDGTSMVFNNELPGDTPFSIWRASLPRVGPETQVVGSRYRLNYPTLSPDGSWLAYVSNPSGRFEAYVQPLTGTRTQLSPGGADFVRWSSRGDEIFFSNGTHIYVVRVSTSPTLRIGAATLLLRDVPKAGANALEFSVSPDAQRFVTLESQNAGAQRLEVVVNWIAEQEARAMSK